jgi:hypothetical protein
MTLAEIRAAFKVANIHRPEVLPRLARAVEMAVESDRPSPGVIQNLRKAWIDLLTEESG